MSKAYVHDDPYYCGRCGMHIDAHNGNECPGKARPKARILACQPWWSKGVYAAKLANHIHELGEDGLYHGWVSYIRSSKRQPIIPQHPQSAITQWHIDRRLVWLAKK